MEIAMKVFYPKNKDFVSYIPRQNQRVMVDIPSWRIVGDINEVIRITFNGKINFEKPFMIKGNISGSIVATSDLVIDSTAVVKADIEELVK